MERVPLTVGKNELLELAGLKLDTGDADKLDAGLAAGLAQMHNPANTAVSFCNSCKISGIAARTYWPSIPREASAPCHRNGVPTDCPDGAGTECSPAFTVLEVPGGYLAQIGRAPVVLLPTRECVVSDYSSGYARLLRAYDLNLPRVLADARRIGGAALVLCDDVWPPNYSHWLLDELPRLAFLGAHRDLSVVVAAPLAGYQRETLLRCGFAPERIVALEDFSAVQADRLLVSRDVHQMPHPAFKGARWALEFLRSELPFTDPPTLSRRKLYISRHDAHGRHLRDEDALMRLLRPLGYDWLELGSRSVAEQALLFGAATHVVGLHGAGLANLAFAQPGTQVIELFPMGYGTPAFYVIAAALGCRYATYVADGEVEDQKERDQIYDARLDLDRFAQACGDIL